MKIVSINIVYIFHDSQIGILMQIETILRDAKWHLVLVP